MELMIAAGKAVAQLQIEHGLAVERVYTGSFMTALDMAGNYETVIFSLHIMGIRMLRVASIFLSKLLTRCMIRVGCMQSNA